MNRVRVYLVDVIAAISESVRGMFVAKICPREVTGCARITRFERIIKG